MLTRKGKSRHPCLVPEFSRKAFSFLPSSIILAMGLSLSSFYYVEICSLCTHFGKGFYHEWMLNFVKCLFCVYCDDDVIFIFPFVSMLYYVDWFMDIEPFLHSQIVGFSMGAGGLIE